MVTRKIKLFGSLSGMNYMKLNDKKTNEKIQAMAFNKMELSEPQRQIKEISAFKSAHNQLNRVIKNNTIELDKQLTRLMFQDRVHEFNRFVKESQKEFYIQKKDDVIYDSNIKGFFDGSTKYFKLGQF